jgi:perosamine synthetase
MLATDLGAEGAEALAERVTAAVRSVLGAPEAMVPLHEPEFRGREWDYVKDCLDTGWVSSVGAYVDRIERDLAGFTGVEHAVGIEAGDEVLVPSLTFVATVNAISYQRAIPHFVDSERVALGVDAAALARHLDRVAERRGGLCRNRATGAVIRALVVTHIFGHPADLDALARICDDWGLVLIEDAAEALGTRYRGRHVGGDGRLAALSFNGNKVMTSGGGGAVLTRDPDLARRAKHLTTVARTQHRWNFVHDEIGYNYRMPNINAALGCAQLERVPDMLARKRRLADSYRAAFAPLNSVQFLDEPDYGTSNFWLNALIVEGASLEQREELLAALNGANYMSRPIWTLIHRLPMYRDCPRAPLANAEALEREVINLPSSANLADGW